MDLAADAREFARWTVKSSVPLADPAEVELTLQPATAADEPEILSPGWIALEWEADATTDDKGRSVRTGRLLVQGPDVSGTTGKALESGVYTTRLRITEDPEITPRDTEPITVGS
jgi:hypothetical protein